LVKAICVDPAHVDKIWPVVSHLVKRAIDRGFSEFPVIEANVLDGMYLLWLAVKGDNIIGVAVTGLVGDACEIIAAAGTDVGTWLHLITPIEDYARAEGRALMRIICRRGWKRLLPDYRETSIVLEKVL
jgi:hypothetical protein